MSDQTTAGAQAIQLRLTCNARAVGKMRNEMQVRFVSKPEAGPFDMATDEAAVFGGEDTAPPPLAYFISGLTACLMTQIRSFAKRHGIVIDRLELDALAIWEWVPAGRVYESAPVGFEIDIQLDSSSSDAEILSLIEAAKKGCFIEQTLGQPNAIRHRYRGADDWLDV